MLVLALFNFGYSQEALIIRLDVDAVARENVLREMPLDFVSENPSGATEIVADQATLDKLTENGIEYTVVRALSRQYVPDYLTNAEVNTYLQLYDAYYPYAEMVQIGVSTQMGLPVYALKISDNAAEKEDETVVWIDGVHHAREPIGMMSCMKVIDYLISGYGNDALATEVVNEMEVWIVPILNPEGYEYFIDSSSASTNPQWWRKNLLDNNANGIFDFDYDGVDLNRNYDCGWDTSTSADTYPGSWLYKGPAPFSEKEVQAKRDLVLELRPLAAISYHSYGEIVYYNTGVNRRFTPEKNLFDSFAHGVASSIPALNGGSYAPVLNDNASESMSYHWMYQVVGCWELLIETGREFVPAISTAQQVAADNLLGLQYFFEHSLRGPGIRGHVRSIVDSSALEATVKINELWDWELTPRRTETVFGRFNRFTDSDTYSLEVTTEGYDTVYVAGVAVDSGWTEVDVYLTPDNYVVANDLIVGPVAFKLIGNYPNPFNPGTTISYMLPEPALVQVAIYDLRGREVRTLLNNRQAAGDRQVRWDATDNAGQAVGAGIYLYRVSIPGLSKTGKMILIK